jgi:multidrug efflux system outer membrane protein
MKTKLPLLALALPLLLAACSVGPDYDRAKVDAQVDVPKDWHWKKAEPNDAQPRGPWWTVYQDPDLNALEDQAVSNNQDLRAAVARVDRGRAQARLSGADFFPQLTLDPQAQRERLGANTPQLRQFSLPGVAIPPATVNSFSVPVDLSYEVDLWGRVRRSFESARDLAQASVADFQNVLLTLTSDVAIDYFTLRQYDAEVKILRQTVETRKKSLDITQKRLQAGRATGLDVHQAETELANSEADLAQVSQSRAQTQDALAFLCGRAAPGFQLPERPLDVAFLPPAIPAGLPASLLERRPDIATAERTMAARNADIGVAAAGYFPQVSITGQFGYLSYSVSNLFTAPSNVWSLGPAVQLPLFTGGKTTAQVKSARAAYDEAAANYRSAVLGSFRDVEDALAAQRYLAQQAEAAGRAAEASSKARALSEERYRSGQVNYFEVTESQRTELGAQRAQAQVVGQRLYASIRLIKALGGGWEGAQLRAEEPAPYPVLPLDSQAPLVPSGGEKATAQ